MGLLRNSKTHALHENESGTSVEILPLIIVKLANSGRSRLTSSMRDEFRNSAIMIFLFQIGFGPFSIIRAQAETAPVGRNRVK